MGGASSGCGAGSAGVVSERSPKEAAEPLLDCLCVEIHEQSCRHACQLEVRDELCVVDWEQLLDGFDFNDEFVLDYEVQAVAALELDSLVAYGNELLTPEAQAREFELPGQAMLICRLE